MDREEGIAVVSMELPLGDAAPDFNLEKAVCSHGLFMMAPNRWDPDSKTFKRPLRLNPDGGGDESSVIVHVSHPPQSPHVLLLRVFGRRVLFPDLQQSLLSQVRRMLRLSDEENRRVLEFHKVHEEARRRGFGRLFRSPTLFEDMVKCILLCNCQWPRTLSMADALCELQKELQHPSPSSSNVIAETGTISSCQTIEVKHFLPRTPLCKESKKKSGVRRCSKKVAKKYAEALGEEMTEMKTSTAEILECSEETGKSNSNPSQDVKKDFLEKCNSWQTSADIPNILPVEATENYAKTRIGNFPSPRELASLDEKFLARRCNLGYRAGRVINLARGVIEGRIQLRELEITYDSLYLSGYDKLAEKLRMIDGFGPFTCANVLMCMGYYHVVPTDSETIRHLKQVHAKSSSIQTVQSDVKDIYGKYAPFQFLAYWSEVWHFYEEWFGNLSEMPHSSFKLITAANMKPMTERGIKKIKLPLHNVHDGSAGRTEA